MLSRPHADEHEEYYGRYIRKVPNGPIVELLAREFGETKALLESVPEDRETFRYEANKWSVRELVGHLIDSERAMAYRTLAFARGDTGPFPSFEEDEYVAASNAHERPLSELVAEFEAVRASDLLMVAGFQPESWSRKGVASGFEFSVRALAYIMLGHEIWHRGVLRERYLKT